jgi:hypothetical protein
LGLISTYQNVRKQKSSKKNQKALEEHNKWLISKGINPSEKIKREKKILDTNSFDSSKNSLSNAVGNGYKTIPSVYNGREIIGIATMHKSNMVPVTSKENATDISKMR